MDNRENQPPSRFDARYRINNTGLIKTASIRPFVLLNSCNSIVSSASAGNLRGKQIISRERNEGLIEAAIRAIPLLSILEEISRRETILFLPPRPKRQALSLFLSPSWPLAYSLFTGQHRSPLIKSRDGWAVKLYKLLISRETYTSRKRDVARNRRKVILPSFLSSSSSYPPRNNYRQPDPIQVSPGSSSHGSL